MGATPVSAGRAFGVSKRRHGLVVYASEMCCEKATTPHPWPLGGYGQAKFQLHNAAMTDFLQAGGITGAPVAPKLCLGVIVCIANFS